MEEQQDQQQQQQQSTIIDIRDKVNKLWKLSYNEQLMYKDNKIVKILKNICNKHKNVKTIPKLSIIKSPKEANYRNKCVYTIGRNNEHKLVCGFVLKRMNNDQQMIISSVENIKVISNISKYLATNMTIYLNQQSYNEFKCINKKKQDITEQDQLNYNIMIIDDDHINLRSGLWSELLIRDSHQEILIEISLFIDILNKNQQDLLKKSLINYFIKQIEQYNVQHNTSYKLSGLLLKKYKIIKHYIINMKYYMVRILCIIK